MKLKDMNIGKVINIKEDFRRKKMKNRIKRRCEKCGTVRGTTIKAKKYYCEVCMKKYFLENYGKQPKEIRIIEATEDSWDKTKVAIAIVSFILGLVVGKVL